MKTKSQPRAGWASAFAAMAAAGDDALLDGADVDVRAVIRIDHLALWTPNLERLAAFYVAYFGGAPGARYTNPAKGFESRFVTFEGGGRLELMKTTTLSPVAFAPGVQRMGVTHFALAVGSEQQVDALTARLKADGYAVIDGPRRTGDGYYESVVLDPDGNRVEITA